MAVILIVLCYFKLMHKYHMHRFLRYILLCTIGGICGHLAGGISLMMLTVFAFGIERVFSIFSDIPNLLKTICMGGILTLSTIAGLLYSVLLHQMVRR